jgi:ABC-type uncharacterized transport system substrate-binding protein
MKTKTESLLIGLFLLASIGLFGWLNISKPRILILHSYDKDYAWVRDMNVGLNRVLSDRYRLSLRWHYMDTKRHPAAAYKQSAGIAARNVILEMQPDVVIALDDDAQNYATRYFVDDPHIRIVFAGVNNQASDYGFDKANNVTGVLERLPVRAIKEALGAAENFKGQTRPLRIAYLGDRSESVSGDIRQLQAFDWAPMRLEPVVQVDTWPEWQAQVQALAGRADVILLTGYRRLYRSASDTKLVPAREVVAWTEANSKLPLLSGNGFFVEDGGMLAIGTSPYEQGEEAARRAIAIAVDGTPPQQMPIATAQHFIVAMNGGKMKARNFRLPQIYEAAARTGDKYIP